MNFLQHQSVQEYCITKFEEDQVLLMHKTTKIAYRYYHLKFTSMLYNKNRYHQILQQPIVVIDGVIYEKELTTLQKQLQLKKDKSQKVFLFKEEQLLNTFIPIIQCLEKLHQKDISHGGICPEGIIFDKNGSIKIRHMKDINKNKYYPQGIPSLSNDMRALGYVLLESTTLQDSHLNNNIDRLLSSVINQYSKGFIYAIIAMTYRMSQYLPKLIKLMQNQIQEQEICPQLRQIYRKILEFEKKETLISKRLNNRSLYNQFKKKLNFTKIHHKNNVSENKLERSDTKIVVQKINIMAQPKSVYLRDTYSPIKQVSSEVLKKMSNWNVKINQILKQSRDKMLNIKNKQEFMKFKFPIKRLRSAEKITNNF